jgi:hypothetical protein
MAEHLEGGGTQELEYVGSEWSNKEALVEVVKDYIKVGGYSF